MAWRKAGNVKLHKKVHVCYVNVDHPDETIITHCGRHRSLRAGETWELTKAPVTCKACLKAEVKRDLVYDAMVKNWMEV
jgi:hypothetical protein